MELLGAQRAQRRHVQQPFQKRVAAPVPLAGWLLPPHPPGAADDVRVGEAIQLGVGGEAQQKGDLLRVRGAGAPRRGEHRLRHVRHHAAEPVPVDQRAVAQRNGPGTLAMIEYVGALSAEAEQIAGALQQAVGVGGGCAQGILGKQQMAEVSRHAGPFNAISRARPWQPPAPPAPAGRTSKARIIGGARPAPCRWRRRV